MQKAIYLAIWISYLLSLSTLSHAQVNFVTGYVGGYYELDAYNDIIARRDAAIQEPIWTLKNLNFMSGVNVGINYRTPVMSVEALWTERFRINREQTRDPMTGNRQPRTTLTERFSGPSLGLNFHIENLLIGGTINYHTFRQVARVVNQERTLLISDGLFGAQVQMGYYKRINRANAIAVYPYAYFPFSTINLSPFDEYLNNSNPSDLDIDLMHFGIRLLIYNGAQRYE
ncbi:MAG: hypothetical protein AAGI23_19475 [Bacteroidota bacterium]